MKILYITSFLTYNILVGKTEGKRPHRRPMHRQEDSIRTDLRENCRKAWTGCIWLRKETSLGSCEHGNEPLGYINGREFPD
jgi:hypothetical protein